MKKIIPYDICNLYCFILKFNIKISRRYLYYKYIKNG